MCTWSGDDPLPEDWAVIAAYVNPRDQAKCVGRELFANTVEAAKDAGVRFVDATIRRENSGGQALSAAIGFTDYRSSAETVSKRLAP